MGEGTMIWVRSKSVNDNPDTISTDQIYTASQANGTILEGHYASKPHKAIQQGKHWTNIFQFNAEVSDYKFQIVKIIKLTRPCGNDISDKF